jgi:phosphate transport system protein
MVLRLFRGTGDDGLERIEQQLLQMLADDRRSFDLACSALIGAADPEVIGPELAETDHRVNIAEQEIRRDLVVHASVHEAVDIPTMLVYMSVAKDIERIGDYAKNIFDLAAAGADFSGADDRDELVSYWEWVSSFIGQAGQVFTDRDAEQAAELISAADERCDVFDARVEALVTAAGPGREAVPRALFYRHLKRIAAHLMNLLSAVVMPLDKLDFFDEDHVGRRR